jgi:hypothetical protein
LNEDAQSALLKLLEEPPPGVTIVLCADRDDLLLPTVMSRCVRLRLGPVAVREIEAMLEEGGVADTPTASRLARLASGRPGAALTLAVAPDGVAARDEIARTLLDLAAARAARRLTVGRELLARAADLVAALDAGAATAGGGLGSAEGGTSKRKGAKRAAARTTPPQATVADGAEGDDPADAADDETAAAVRAPATERRRAAAALVDVWRDVNRDLLLVTLGEERRLRDPALLDDYRAAAAIPADRLRDFATRLARSAELLESNVSPELVVDVLLVAWPRPAAAA